MKPLLLSLILTAVATPLFAQQFSYSPMSMRTPVASTESATQIEFAYKNFAVGLIYIYQDLGYIVPTNQVTPYVAQKVVSFDWKIITAEWYVSFSPHGFPIDDAGLLNSHIRISASLSDRLDIYYNHISNAGTAKENLGADNLGVRINFGKLD